MKLLIKQRVFSWTDTYDVYNENLQPKYFVKAEFFTFGHQIHVYDARTNREVGSIHERILTFLPCFNVVMGGRDMGTVRKRFTFFHPQYDVEYGGWEIEGDFFGWDYEVRSGSRVVMRISKEFFRWGDTYTLTYENPAEELAGLLLVIAIDAANCSNN